jgi:hypothetical protein
MKLNKTIFLIIILLVLIVIKFKTPFSINSDTALTQTESSIIQVDLSNSISSSEPIKFGRINGSDKFYFNLLYVVLYDKYSKSLIEDYKPYFEERLNLFDKVLSRESLGKIVPSSELVFIDIKEFGSKELSYDKSIFDWIKAFDIYFKDYDHNILSFAPIYEMPWCMDGPSQGFNYKGNAYFCPEAFFNPMLTSDNKRSVALMIHKFLHAVGYNHQDQMFKQYSFIDWSSGLPETNILLHSSSQEFEGLFFDEHILKSLGILEKESFEENCLDAEGFLCKPANNFFCEDSWGSFCQDIDKDGSLDSEDNYIFSSSIKGNDSDNDGIVDFLDLCPDNEIIVSGKNIEVKKTKIEALTNRVKLTFESDFLITTVVSTPMKMIGGFIRFLKEDEAATKGNSITISKSSEMYKIQVYYSNKTKGFYRTYYLTFPGFNADFFSEREWYYINRFGCDASSLTNFQNLLTYDKNFDGLPDKDLFSWAEKINEFYDWDGDGWPDLEDNLPTIKGNCSNEFVKGVKDSDNDGLCNPGQFDFDKDGIEDFNEIAMVVLNPEYDHCPYLVGSVENNGCPSSNWYK